MRQTVYNDGVTLNLNEINLQQLKLLYAATKHITILSVAIICTLLPLSMGVIFRAIDESSGNDQTWSIFLYLLLSSIDSVITIICLSLQFKFNRKYYNQYCICFGNCLVNCCLSKEMNHKISTLPPTPSSTARVADLPITPITITISGPNDDSKDDEDDVVDNDDNPQRGKEELVYFNKEYLEAKEARDSIGGDPIGMGFMGM